MDQGRRRALALSLLVLLIVLVATLAVWRWRTSTTGSRDDATAAPDTTIEPPTGPLAPLTGLVDPSGETGHRCAVTVKVGNTADSDPHDGIEQADVVYEEVVEGGITRLVAVYHSQAPERVGPVRSVRQTDQSLVWPLRGIFAFSGGNADELASIEPAPVTRLDETRAGSMMSRDPNRVAPHNLYAHVDQMYARCADPPPPALFAYRPAEAPAAGDPVTSVHVGFTNGFDVTWTWDAAGGRWQRSRFGRPELTAAGEQLSATNVVILFTAYQGGVGVEGAEAQLTGEGRAQVFTDGRVVEGAWSRAAKAEPARLTDAGGRPIGLTPGTTWVELPDVSYVVTTSP